MSAATNPRARRAARRAKIRASSGWTCRKCGQPIGKPKYGAKTKCKDMCPKCTRSEASDSDSSAPPGLVYAHAYLEGLTLTFHVSFHLRKTAGGGDRTRTLPGSTGF